MASWMVAKLPGGEMTGKHIRLILVNASPDL